MRPLLVAALAGACLSGAAPVRADAPATDTQAHQAYERGTQAYRRKDYATAAREYAAADALSPNPTALQAALDAAVQVDDPVLGAQLLDRARGSPRTNSLVSTMLVAEQKFAHRTGRIGVACAAQPCLATIDGAAVDPSRPVVVRVGSHTVMVDSAGAASTQTVTVPPDETVTVASAAPPAPTPAPASPSSSSPAPPPMTSTDSPLPPPPPVTDDAPGISRVWFLVGAGATVLVGGVTLASAIDVASQNGAFAVCRTASATASDDCGQRQSNGQSAQARTNVLLGVTAVLGLATVVLIPFVRWHGMTAGATVGGLAFDARF
jgi:hypothetical protein